jgi:ATP-dependent exoDNAse (exonuclease V) beta subunit
LDHDEALRGCCAYCPEDTWDRTEDMTEGHPWLSDHHSKNRETLIRSIIWYLDEFRNDPAATLILANGKPAVELSFRMEMEWGPNTRMETGFGRFGNDTQPYLLCGHLDRVVEFGGQKYVMDRKTTGSSPTPHYFDGFAPDNQMSIYTLAARVQFSTPVAGVIIDAAQVAVGFTRFQRGFTYRTEAQLEEWLADFRFWTAQAEGFAERATGR